MVALSCGFTEIGDEFALVAQTTAEAVIPGDTLPRVRRGWVNVPTGGHVSGVFWGERPQQVSAWREGGRHIADLAENSVGR